MSNNGLFMAHRLDSLFSDLVESVPLLKRPGRRRKQKHDLHKRILRKRKTKRKQNCP